MEKEKLTAIVEKHQDWLLGKKDGKQANLQDANLQDANLYGADLRGADLRDADLSPFQICPETGSFNAWKKLQNNVVIKLTVPTKAKRTSSIVGRKCRAEYVKVLEGSGKGLYNGTVYAEGAIVKADAFDDDPRIECSHGIHFFLTKKEAEDYRG